MKLFGIYRTFLIVHELPISAICQMFHTSSPYWVILGYGVAGSAEPFKLMEDVTARWHTAHVPLNVCSNALASSLDNSIFRFPVFSKYDFFCVMRLHSTHSHGTTRNFDHFVANRLILSSIISGDNIAALVNAHREDSHGSVDGATQPRRDDSFPFSAARRARTLAYTESIAHACSLILSIDTMTIW